MLAMKRPGINFFQSWSVNPVCVSLYFFVQSTYITEASRNGCILTATAFKKPNAKPSVYVRGLSQRYLPLMMSLHSFQSVYIRCQSHKRAYPVC